MTSHRYSCDLVTDMFIIFWPKWLYWDIARDRWPGADLLLILLLTLSWYPRPRPGVFETRMTCQSSFNLIASSGGIYTSVCGVPSSVLPWPCPRKAVAVRCREPWQKYYYLKKLVLVAIDQRYLPWHIYLLDTSGKVSSGRMRRTFITDTIPST